jgi:hypothetical protein
MSLRAIPAELRERPQWVLWRYEVRDGKPTKAPYQVRHPDRRASSTDARTWSPFEEAIASVERADGIGYAFSTDDPFFGADLDGELPEADKRAILSKLETYSEHSVSGTGYHVIGRGRLPEGSRKRKGPIEIYDSGRFFVMTGAHVRGTPETIEARQAELEEVIAHFLPQPNTKDLSDFEPQPVDLADEDLLDRARRAKNGADFERLWTGDTSGYASHSEADLALCSRLAFWTGRDPDRIDRMFRASGLYREKWEREDYRTATIEEAIAGCRDVYAPRGPAKTPAQATAQQSSARGEGDAPAWQPLPLSASAAEPPPKPEHFHGLGYGFGTETLMSSEPGIGKSMVIAALAAETARAGLRALVLDFERTSGMWRERLDLFGLAEEELGRVFYLRPNVQASSSEIRQMVALVQPAIVALDSYDAALAAFGRETKNEDVRAFHAEVIEPLRSTNAGVFVADHLAKNRETRGRYSIGGQAKLALAEVHLGLTPIVGLRRGSGGKLKIRVHKDTFGWLPHSATFELVDEDGLLSWTVKTDEDDAGPEGEFRPTGYMERVSRALEIAGTGLTLNRIEQDVGGKREYVRQAVGALLREGHAEEEEGPRRARLITLVRPFREDDDA